MLTRLKKKNKKTEMADTKNFEKKEVFQSKEIQIFLKTLTSATKVFNIDLEDTIEEIKQKIGKKENLPQDMRLIYQQKELEDKQKASYYDIKKDTTIHLVFRLKAGVKIAIKGTNDQIYSLSNFSKIQMTTNEEDSQPERKKQKRGSYAKRACKNCRNSHTACDSGRPCKRCLQLGLTDCQDAERKKKKRNFEEFEEKKEFPSMKDFLPMFSNSKEEKQDTSMKQIFSNLMDENEETNFETFDNEENFNIEEILNKKEDLLEFDNFFLNDLSTTENIKIEEEEKKTNLNEFFDESNNFDTSFLLQNNLENEVSNVITTTTTQNEIDEKKISNEIEQRVQNYKEEDKEKLIRSLLVAHIAQEQELRELRNLVSHLQNLLISNQMSQQISNQTHQYTNGLLM
jgi:hypothetical protein